MRWDVWACIRTVGNLAEGTDQDVGDGFPVQRSGVGICVGGMTSERDEGSTLGLSEGRVKWMLRVMTNDCALRREAEADCGNGRGHEMERCIGSAE